MQKQLTVLHFNKKLKKIVVGVIDYYEFKAERKYIYILVQVKKAGNFNG